MNPRRYGRGFVKQLILSMKLFIERIFAYCFDVAASKAPSDEGAVSEAD